MEGEAGAAPRMPLDPARRRAGGRGRGEHALQFRASAFVPPPGKGEGDAAECRICLQTDLCTALIKPCGCEHKPSRSAYVHQDCILKWIERDKRSREGGCKICKQDWKFQEKGKKRGGGEASRREDEPRGDRDVILALGVLYQYLWSRVKAHTASEKEEILLLEAGLQRPGPWTSWVNRTLEKQKSLFSLSPQSISMGDMRPGGGGPGSRRGSAQVGGGGAVIPTGGSHLTRRIRRSSMLRERGAPLTPPGEGDEGAGHGGSARRPSLMGGYSAGRSGSLAPEPRNNSVVSQVSSAGRSRSSTGSSTASSFRLEDPRRDSRSPAPEGAAVLASSEGGALTEAWERMASGAGTVADLHLFVDESAKFHGPWTELLRGKERRMSIDASSVEAGDASLFQVLSTSWYALCRGQGGLSDLRTLVRKGGGALGPWSQALGPKQEGPSGRARRASVDVSSMISSGSFPSEEDLAVATGEGAAGAGNSGGAVGNGREQPAAKQGHEGGAERRLSISLVEKLIAEAVEEVGGPFEQADPEAPAVAADQASEEELLAAKAAEEEEEEEDKSEALCWVCSIGGDIFEIHRTCACVGANQYAHADCWKSWVKERKTEALKTHCPDCGSEWKLLHLMEEVEPERPVFDDHTGAEIRDPNDTGSPHNAERPQTEDIKNALTVLYSRVAQNNLTPRNKDMLRLVGSQFPGEWSKWIKQQVAHRRRNRLSVSGPAEEMAPVEPSSDAPGAAPGEGPGEEEEPARELKRKPSIADFIPFLTRRKSFAGFKTNAEAEAKENHGELERHVTLPKKRTSDRRSLPSLTEDAMDPSEMPDRRRSILTYTPEPRARGPDEAGAEGEAVSTSQIDLAERIAEKSRRGSNFGIFSFKGQRATSVTGEALPERKGSILDVFSTFSRRFSVSVKKKGLFGRRATAKLKTPTRLRIEADGDREAWEDQAPARGHDDYEAKMHVTCFCCYSAKPDLR